MIAEPVLLGVEDSLMQLERQFFVFTAIVIERPCRAAGPDGFGVSAVFFRLGDLAGQFQISLLQYVSPQDLKSFGLIPEIIGRLPLLCHLNQLDRQALRSILTEPKNSIIKQYVKMFDMDDVKLTFDEDVLEYIVDKAVEFKLGARGLRSIVETIMLDVMFEIPSSGKKKVSITKAYAESKIQSANIEKLRVA